MKNINEEEIKSDNNENDHINECDCEKKEVFDDIEKSKDVEIEKLKLALNDANDKRLRAIAEMENIKKQSSKAINNQSLDTKIKILKEFVDILDSFERAKLIEDKSSQDWIKGIDIIYETLNEKIKILGVEKINSLEKFDALKHISIGTDNIDDIDSDMITEILQTGYKIGDKILKPAMVKINKK